MNAAVVYITSSRRTVQLGYTQGLYQRFGFPIQKLIRQRHQQNRPDCTGEGCLICTYSMVSAVHKRLNSAPQHSAVGSSCAIPVGNGLYWTRWGGGGGGGLNTICKNANLPLWHKYIRREIFIASFSTLLGWQFIIAGTGNISAGKIIADCEKL